MTDAVHRTLLRAACILPLLAACRSNASEIEELDARCRSVLGMETVVYEDAFSLYSPYEASATGKYQMMVGLDLRTVSTLFDVELSPPVMVWLWPAEGLGLEVEWEGDMIHVSQPEVPPPKAGGFASGEWAVIRVGPPQRTTREDGIVTAVSYEPSLYRKVIRHEITHVLAARAGLRGKAWFNEGIARTLEWMDIEGHTLVFGEQPAYLHQLADVPTSERGLADLLDWEVTRHGPEAEDSLFYALAHSYMLYRIDGASPEILLPTLRRIAALSREEHLAGEADWMTWIDALGDRASGESHTASVTLLFPGSVRR